MRAFNLAILTLGTGCLVSPAHAAVEPFASFTTGFAHPVLGIDHVLAMVTRGCVGRACGSGRALWVWPAVFVSTMLAGFAAATLGLSAPRGPRCGGGLDHRAGTHGSTCGKGAPVAGCSPHRSVRFLSWSRARHRGDRGQPRRLWSRICPSDGCTSRRRHRPRSRRRRFHWQACGAGYGRSYRSWWAGIGRGLT